MTKFLTNVKNTSNKKTSEVGHTTTTTTTAQAASLLASPSLHPQFLPSSPPLLLPASSLSFSSSSPFRLHPPSSSPLFSFKKVMRVVLITATSGTQDDDETPLLAKLLKDSHNVDTVTVAWDQEDVFEHWHQSDLGIIQATWNYHLKFDAFVSWLNEVRCLPFPAFVCVG